MPSTSAHFPFFEQLSTPMKRSLVGLPMTRAPKSKLLLTRGDDAQGAYFVVEGALRVFYLTDEGREATLYRVEPGGTCLLALTSTFNAEPYPAWVESSERGASFVRVPPGLFRRLFDEEPPFREFLFSALSGRIFELMQSLEEASTSRLEQRLARLLLRRVEDRRRVVASQARLAAELGTAREVVSRTLQQFKRRGLVAIARGSVQLLDEPALQRLASGT